PWGGATARARRPRGAVPLRRRSRGFPQRSANLLLGRQVRIDLRERAVRIGEGPAELDERVPRDEIPDRRCPGARAELFLELEDDALRRLLADAGDRLEPRRVLERDRTAQLRRRRARDDRERNLRADAVHRKQMDEQIALVG